MMPYFMDASKGFKESLKNLYTHLGASLDDTIFFTQSGAEAVNQVMMSVYFTYVQEFGRNHFIVHAGSETPSILAGKRLESLGCSCKVVSKDIAGAITPRTILISMSLADGLTGLIYPYQEIADLCETRGILLHLDITHGFGKIPIDLSKISFVTFRGEPLHAPSGTGILAIKSGVKAVPLILGGGAFSLPNLVGLSQAVTELMDAKDYVCTEIARLRTLLEDGLMEIGGEVLFINEERVPHITAIAFPGVNSEVLLYHLNQKGTSACIGGGDFQPLSRISNTAISFSLSRNTTEEEILKTIAVTKEAYGRLKGASKVFY